MYLNTSSSQELYGRFLDYQQGLLSKECYDIIQDNQGYLPRRKKREIIHEIESYLKQNQ